MEYIAKSIKEKALSLNLDDTIYGTIAEIGGGQETARAFFQAGGASGTIAKSISAYDKTFSDVLYCKGIKAGRYVSEDRLTKMLEKEYNELVHLLDKSMEPATRFFAFANTVETLNYYKDNEGHGWIGVRFQLTAGGLPNEVVIHVRLLENDGLLQQYTLGALGVNLLYACFYYTSRPEKFLLSLLDNLSNDRLEITMARMSGPELNYVDNRLLSVQLVKNGMTPAVFFNRKGQVMEPDEMLYKKNLLALRGSFRPITYVGIDMLKSAYALFKNEPGFDKENSLTLCEITLNNLIAGDQFNERDFLDRVDLLNGIGQNVMVSNFREYYKMTAYLARHRIRSIGIIIGVPTFSKVIDPSYYNHLKGGILEAFGRLFMQNLKVYLYPALDPQSGKLISGQDLNLTAGVRHLYNYLLSNNQIVDLKEINTNYIHIFPHDVLQMIQNDDKNWEKWVPVFVADLIKTRQIFGYHGSGDKTEPKKCH